MNQYDPGIDMDAEIDLSSAEGRRAYVVSTANICDHYEQNLACAHRVRLDPEEIREAYDLALAAAEDYDHAVAWALMTDEEWAAEIAPPMGDGPSSLDAV